MTAARNAERIVLPALFTAQSPLMVCSETPNGSPWQSIPFDLNWIAPVSQDPARSFECSESYIVNITCGYAAWISLEMDVIGNSTL